jgi:hypothetical protein
MGYDLTGQMKTDNSNDKSNDALQEKINNLNTGKTVQLHDP